MINPIPSKLSVSVATHSADNSSGGNGSIKAKYKLKQSQRFINTCSVIIER